MNTKSPSLITEQDLQAWTGYRHRDSLINWLRSHDIPYWLGNKGIICVTAEAVNSALLKINYQQDINQIEF